jgi:DNA-binding transcriptional LysR family regulator
MNITIKQLLAFVAITQHGNVTKAAQSIFLSQSAVSMALAELESQLKYPLFDRIGKKLILNMKGANLLPKAAEIIDRIREIENLGENKTLDLVGTVKIGASSTIGNYILPPLIGHFITRHPGVKIVLQVGNTKQIINELVKFNIDIGFIEDSCDLAEINTEVWAKDELILFSSPSYWLAKLNIITTSDLQNVRWILRENGSGTRNVFEKAMANYFKQDNIILELGSTEAIKTAVKEGIGISCLSRFTLTDELESNDVIELPVNEISIKRNFYCLTHKDKYMTQALQTLQAELNLVER